jgi:hypothetical protein
MIQLDGMRCLAGVTAGHANARFKRNQKKATIAIAPWPAGER